ncbi:MAG: DUF374 domain-containing protein [Deltaproteobacteria bacterium]|nr:DUF374 domain-containing protein [Deltaproteobacteria bacterium]
MSVAARCLPALYRAYMRLVYATGRADESATRALIARHRSGARIVLLMLHQDVFAAPWFLRGLPVCGLAAIGDAGDIIAAAMASLGHTTVRGGTSERASRRRTHGALRDMIRYGKARAAEGFVMAITPDGSYGPAGACKPGFGLLALETDAELWCIKIRASRAVYAPTWDRTMIPLPLAAISAELSGPVVIPSDTDAAALEGIRREIEERLHALHREAFAAIGRAPVPELKCLQRAAPRS